MASFRMIAIDLDGTLLSPAGMVTPRTREAIHRLLAAGWSVAFATGRNFTESRPILDSVGHHGPFVFAGGAMVIDTAHGVTLHRVAIAGELAAEVCGILESWGHAVLALQDTARAGVDYLMSGNVEPHAATKVWMSVTSAAVRKVPSLADHDHQHTIRVGICGTAEDVQPVQQRLSKKFGRKILCQSLHVPSPDVFVMEVFDPQVCKWQAVLRVAGMHGIAAEEIIAVGDDINDIPMLRAAGLGVAMGNARPNVQAAARRVIGSNREEGLAAFLESLLADGATAPLEEEVA